jgi:thymidylate kinase
VTALPDLAAWARQHEIIVLEGCDGTGKTTIANALAADHGYTVVHAARSPDGTDLMAKYRQILNGPAPLVLDRCFISEFVYGPLVHGGSRLSHSEAVQLAGLLAARGGLLVHLTGQPEVIAARLLARDGQAPSLPHLRAITRAYLEIFARLDAHAPVITIDTTVSA